MADGRSAAAYLLGWRWQKQMHRQVAEEPPPVHYTDRDRQAWKRIEDHIKDTEKVKVDDIAGLQLYVDVAQKLAPELAAIYHPEATDPMGNLTIPEILAVVELAAHDLGEMTQDLFARRPPRHHQQPARGRGKAVKWYNRANETFWAVSAVLDPIRTGLRYAARGRDRQVVRDVQGQRFPLALRELRPADGALSGGTVQRPAESRRRALPGVADEQESKPVGLKGHIVLDSDERGPGTGGHDRGHRPGEGGQVEPDQRPARRAPGRH